MSSEKLPTPEVVAGKEQALRPPYRKTPAQHHLRSLETLPVEGQHVWYHNTVAGYTYHGYYQPSKDKDAPWFGPTGNTFTQYVSGWLPYEEMGLAGPEDATQAEQAYTCLLSMSEIMAGTHPEFAGNMKWAAEILAAPTPLPVALEAGAARVCECCSGESARADADPCDGCNSVGLVWPALSAATPVALVGGASEAGEVDTYEAGKAAVNADLDRTGEFKDYDAHRLISYLRKQASHGDNAIIDPVEVEPVLRALSAPTTGGVEGGAGESDLRRMRGRLTEFKAGDGSGEAHVVTDYYLEDVGALLRQRTQLLADLAAARAGSPLGGGADDTLRDCYLILQESDCSEAGRWEGTQDDGGYDGEIYTVGADGQPQEQVLRGVGNPDVIAFILAAHRYAQTLLPAAPVGATLSEKEGGRHE